MPMRRSVPLLGLALALAACTSVNEESQTSNIPPEPIGTPQPSVAVEVRNNVFVPNNPLIVVGGSVTWTWVGSGHSVTPDGTPQFTPGAPVSNAPHTLGPVVFATAGVYSFHCTVHGTPGRYGTGTMTGAVFVRQPQ
jgi:plastocyanin